MYMFVRSGKASCCIFYMFSKRINQYIDNKKIHPLFMLLPCHVRSTDRNQAFGAPGSLQCIHNSCRLTSLRCFGHRQLNCESRRCNLPASSQIVLVLFCIQTFDRHSDCSLLTVCVTLIWI